MFGLLLDYAIAVALLTSPPAEGADLSPYVRLRPVMQKIALEWEVLDPREVTFLLARNKDFSDDVCVIQQRWQEFKDAPFIDEVLRFPDRTVVNDFLTFNRSYRSDLKNASEIVGGHARWWYEAAIQETDILYRVWEKVHDARNKSCYITVRRQALKNFRELVGAECFYSGQLPPYIPIWRLPRTD